MIKTPFRLTLAIALGAAVTGSQAFTMATFADPALDETTPLFTIAGNSISGGWASTGLLLQTPGWGAPDYADAKFTMAPVPISLIVPGFWSTGAGQVDFTDSSNNLVLRITFQSGTLSQNGVGGSDLFGNNVAFSGPGVPAGLTQETFNFSFANLASTPNGTTATASFTSSAVPEPATLGAIGIGIAALLRRRRR